MARLIKKTRTWPAQGALARDARRRVDLTVTGLQQQLCDDQRKRLQHLHVDERARTPGHPDLTLAHNSRAVLRCACDGLPPFAYATTTLCGMYSPLAWPVSSLTSCSISSASVGSNQTQRYVSSSWIAHGGARCSLLSSAWSLVISPQQAGASSLESRLTGKANAPIGWNEKQTGEKVGRLKIPPPPGRGAPKHRSVLRGYASPQARHVLKLDMTSCGGVDRGLPSQVILSCSLAFGAADEKALVICCCELVGIGRAVIELGGLLGWSAGASRRRPHSYWAGVHADSMSSQCSTSALLLRWWSTTRLALS